MTITIDWSQLISSIVGALIGGGFAILGAILSIKASIKHLREEFQYEREKAKQNSFMALKVEVRENLKTLKEDSIYSTLSNESWNSCRHIIGEYCEKEDVDTLCNAYIAVGKVNGSVNFIVNGGSPGSISNYLSNAKETAEDFLMKAENILDNYLKTNEKLNDTQT